MDKALLDFVMDELAARKGTWPAICNDVPSIDYSWLAKLAQGHIPDPGIKKIQLLSDYFRGIKRKAA